MKKIKYLLLLFLIIPFINIKALVLCDGVELPDVPSNINRYIIVKTNTNRYRLYGGVSSNDSTFTFVINRDNQITITNNDPENNYVYYFQYRPDINTDWQNNGSNANQYILYKDSTYDEFLASSVNVVSADDSSVIVYSSGYNLDCPEIIPQNFNIINNIASKINDFVLYLQNNNISIHITFISLIIFNFLVFVLCYIVSHFE